MRFNKLPRFLQPGNESFIWFLGFGYFLCYIPYAALTKATTKGLLPGLEAVSGTSILPLSAAVTFATVFLFVTLKRWWRHVPQKTILGLPIRLPRAQTVISGFATAVIIGTTTMAFSFDGVSIVFSLIVMRGGVLIIARITDAIARRKVAWNSMTGLILTLAALMVLFAEGGGFAMTLPAAINLCLYLSGYTVRFQIIRKFTKTQDHSARMRYFVEEQMVAMPTLVLGLAFLALFAGDPLTLGLRDGFLAIWSSPALIPTILIGFGYGCLFVFGTMIYLDPREYTFCVPVNRAASILSGVVATYALYFLLGYSAPSPYQLAGAALLISAVLVLGIPTLGNVETETPLQRVFLFVCGGNRLRSPIAQTICSAELSERLGISEQQLLKRGIRIESAGLSAEPGSGLKPLGDDALSNLGLSPLIHQARSLTQEMVTAADHIFCMTQEQHGQILALASDGKAEVHCLGGDGDLEEPKDLAAALNFGAQVRSMVRLKLAELV